VLRPAATRVRAEQLRNACTHADRRSQLRRQMNAALAAFRFHAVSSAVPMTGCPLAVSTLADRVSVCQLSTRLLANAADPRRRGHRVYEDDPRTLRHLRA